jgi:hypothetical protein
MLVQHPNKPCVAAPYSAACSVPLRSLANVPCRCTRVTSKMCTKRQSQYWIRVVPALLLQRATLHLMVATLQCPNQQHQLHMQ